MNISFKLDIFHGIPSVTRNLLNIRRLLIGISMLWEFQNLMSYSMEIPTKKKTSIFVASWRADSRFLCLYICWYFFLHLQNCETETSRNGIRIETSDSCYKVVRTICTEDTEVVNNEESQIMEYQRGRLINLFYFCHQWIILG